MRVLKNYFWNISYQVFIIFVPLITIPYISRVLGPNGVGINSYTNSIIQYFILFGSIGVGFYGNRQIAFVRENRVELSKTFWEILILRSVTLLMAFVFYLIFCVYYQVYSKYLIAQMFLLLAAFVDIAWFFQGLENFRVTVIRNMLVKIVSIFAIFLFVKNSNDTILYILIIGISTLIGNITLFPYLKKYVSYVPIKQLNIWQHLKPSFALFIPQIAIQIYVVLNKTMLGNMISTNASGFYDNSDKIVRMILAIVTATGTVLLPHIAHLYVKEGRKGISRIFAFSFDFVSLVSVPLCFGLAAISDKLAILFLGNRFKIVGSLLMIESLAALFIAWDNAIGTQYLLPTKQNFAYTKAVTLGAVINAIFNIPLIYFWGVQGSMVATVLSEIGVTLSMLFAIRKQISLRNLFQETWKYFVAAIVMFIIVRNIDGILNTSWLSLSVECLIGVCVYCIFMLVFRPSIFKKLAIFLEGKDFL